MNILFTICGRAGSKGVKNKNIKEFLGFPLPFYTASIIDLFIKKNVQYDCDIVLNTDSKDLISFFNDKLNMKVNIIERSADLSQDSTPKIRVIQNSYSTMKMRLNKDYDFIVDLDITSPLRTLSNLEELIEKKINSGADTVFSVTESRRNPYFNMVMETVDGYERVIKSDYNARQEAPDIYDMNASMYAISPELLIKGKGIFDSKCDIVKMLDTGILDIDSERDFELMQVIAEYLYNKINELRLVKDNITSILSDK